MRSFFLRFALVGCGLITAASCAHGFSPSGLSLIERKEVSECLAQSRGGVPTPPECHEYFWGGLSAAESKFSCSTDEDCRVVHIADGPDYWGWFAVPSRWDEYDTFLEGVMLRCGMSTPSEPLGPWPKAKCRNSSCVVDGVPSVAPPKESRCSISK